MTHDQVEDIYRQRFRVRSEAAVPARWNHLRPVVIRASLKGERGLREGQKEVHTTCPARNRLASLQEARYAAGRSWACSTRASVRSSNMTRPSVAKLQLEAYVHSGKRRRRIKNGNEASGALGRSLYSYALPMVRALRGKAHRP
ncbi:hypothetical protein K439DRAFT_399398 [Ramaria rubella]|nr:hypothetical protein K439DRAFT_399398 [Ramaria rubella]